MPTPGDNLDDQIEARRAVTPPSDIQQRKVPRASIAELNAADIESIHARMLAQRADNRSSISRTLDLIDLPRNLVGNAIARTITPSAVEAQRQAGNYGTLGIPEVSGSDILKGLGVNNRIVNGLVGFGVDVATDPLTYLGPGAFTQSGKTVLTRGGTAVLKKSAKAAAVGGFEAVADPLAKEVIRSAGLTAERAARLRAAEAAGKIRPGGAETLASRVVFGKQEGNRAARNVQEVTRDFRYKGGILDNAWKTAVDGTPAREAEKIAASKAFVEKYGRGAKSYKIGAGGSQVAHIPFTDYAVEVPAFTGMGRHSVSQLQAVRDTQLGVDVLRAHPAIAAVHDLAQEIRTSTQAAKDQHEAFVAQHADLTDRIATGDPLAAEELATAAADHRAAMKQTAVDAQAKAEQLDAAMKGMDPSSWGEDSKRASTFLTLRAMRDEANAAVRASAAQANLADEAIKLRNGVTGEVNAAVERKLAPLGITDPAALEAARKDLRAKEVASRLKNARVDLFQMADASPEAATSLADALHKSTAASVAYAKILDGAVDTLNTATERQFAGLAQLALGSDDLMTGTAVLSPLRNMVESAGADENGVRHTIVSMADGIDRSGRHIFGRKSGFLPRAIAKMKRGVSSRQARATIGEVSGELSNELEAVAKAHGLNQRGYEEARGLHSLATIRALQMLAERAGTKADLTFKTVKDGKLVDSAMVEELLKLQSKGSLAGVDPGFYDDLDKTVSRWLDGLNQITDAEVKDEILGGMMESYLPNMMSEQAMQAYGKMRRTPNLDGVRSAARAAAEESFSTRRSTWVAQFQDPATGEWKQFYEGDRWVQALSENDLNAMRIEDPARTAEIEQLKSTIDQYDSMIDAPPMKAMEPFQINEDFRGGRFSTLTGGSMDVEDFFDTSLPLILAKRQAVHDAAVSRGTIREFLAQHYLPIPGDVLDKGLQEGVPVTLPNGTTLVRLGSVSTPVPGESAMAVRIGGKTYRQLSASTIKSHGSFVNEMLGQELSHGVYNELVADAVDRIAAVTATGSSELDGLLGAANKATSIFKILSLSHPSWMVNNIVGDFTLAAQGGAKVQKILGYLPTVIKARLARDNPELLATLRTVANGQTHDGAVLNRMFRDHGVQNDNASVETIFQALSRGILALPSHFFNVSLRSGLSEDMRHALNHWGIGGGAVQKATGAAQGAATIMTDRLMRRVIGPWFRANAFVSDAMRGATMLAHMDEGMDAATAAQKTVRSMFDYSDFTRVEEKYFRTLIPFYSWVRNNTAFQMAQLLEKPYQAAVIPKIQDALEELFDGESRLPDNQRPRWMLDALALQVGSDPTSRFGLMLNGAIPAADTFNVLQGVTGSKEGVKEALHYFANQTNPLIQALVSVGAGQDFFSGRQIGFDGVSGDVQVGEYLARQIRPVSELGLGVVEGKIPKAFGQSFGEGVGRTLLGGRVQAMDDERLRSSRLADFKKKEEAYRRAISRAERGGNKDASLEARVGLLQMYREMQDTGLGDETPKWAQKQVESLQ